MKKYTDEAVICYDADAAGQKATEKAIDILKASGLAVQVLRLPPRRDEKGKIIYNADGTPAKVDPDDFIRLSGAEAFRTLLDKPPTDGQYRMSEIRRKYGELADDAQRIAYIKEAVQYIAGISSTVEREVYAHAAAKEAGVSPDSVLTEAKRLRESRRRRQEKQLEQEALQPERLRQPQAWELHYDDPASAAMEERVVTAVLGDGALLRCAKERLSPEWFSSPFLAKIYRMALERMEAGLEPDASFCMSQLEPDELRQFTRILSSPVRERTDEALLDEYIQKIEYRYQKRTAPPDDDALLRAAVQRKKG